MKRFILILLAALPVWSHAGPMVPPAELHRLGITPPEAIARHLDQLSLSAEQKTKVTEILETARTESPNLDAAIREHREELEATITNTPASLEAAEALLNELLHAENEAKRLQLRTILGLHNTLTPEQRVKAIEFARQDAELQPIIQAKMERIKAAVDALGHEPPRALEARGKAISILLEEGDPAEANRALDAAIADLGLDDTSAPVPVDFSQFDPGNIDLPVLEQRYHAVEEKLQGVLRLSTLRQMILAHESLEQAKATQDATAVGRILTWAEGVLK